MKKEKLIGNLKGYNFNELKIFLKLQKNSEVRGIFLDAMKKYYPEEFIEFVDKY